MEVEKMSFSKTRTRNSKFPLDEEIEAFGEINDFSTKARGGFLSKHTDLEICQSLFSLFGDSSLRSLKYFSFILMRKSLIFSSLSRFTFLVLSFFASTS